MLYNTDNADSCAWARSGFANNNIAQDLCRLVSALQFSMQHSVSSLWWPTDMNTLTDLLSRMLDEDGNVTAKGQADFETENSKLERRIVNG